MSEDEQMTADLLRVGSPKDLSGKAVSARSELENRVKNLQIQDTDLLKTIALNQLDLAERTHLLSRALYGLGIIVVIGFAWVLFG